MEKTQHFNSSILKVEYSSTHFSKAKIRIMYTGHNRNGSYMRKEVIQKAVESSLAGVPIIGCYVEDDFTDHATDIEYNDKTDEFEWKSFTVPYGFIPKEANIYWEEVREYDNKINEYLVVEGAILWTGRYKEAAILTKEARNHSMEIDIINGREAVIDKQSTFEVTEFEFTGLCILANTTEPCFESSTIQAFSLKEDSFKKEYENMMFQLKQEFNNLEGGTSVTENITNEVVETEVDTATEETQVEFTETEVEQSTEQVDETVVDDFAKDDEEDEDEDKTDDSEDDSEADESDDEDKKKKYEANKDSVVEVQLDTSVIEAKLAEFEAEYEKLKVENAELKAYKHKRESEDLREKFGTQITDAEFNSVLEANEDLAQVEDKVFALIGKKNFSLESNVKEISNKQAMISVEEQVVLDSPYGNLFD